MSDPNSSDQERAKSKWEDKLINLSGQTLKENEEELNVLWKEQQQIVANQELKAYRQMKRKKQLLHNAFTVEKSTKEDMDRVPIDGDVMEGSRIFMTACASCHSLETRQDKWQKGSGPSLARIFGKPSAANKLYNNYSEPLLKADLVWNQWNLYNWVKNPQAMVKETTCLSIGMSRVEGVEDRTDLVKFLKQFSKQMNLYVRREIGRHQGSEHRDYTQFAHEKAVELMKEKINGMVLREEQVEEEKKMKIIGDNAPKKEQTQKRVPDRKN